VPIPCCEDLKPNKLRISNCCIQLFNCWRRCPLVSNQDTEKRHSRALKTHFHQRKTFKPNVLKNNPAFVLKFQGRFVVIFTLVVWRLPKVGERQRKIKRRPSEQASDIDYSRRDNYGVVNIAAPSAVPCRPGDVYLFVCRYRQANFFWSKERRRAPNARSSLLYSNAAFCFVAE
jgi:hypothetical protein